MNNGYYANLEIIGVSSQNGGRFGKVLIAGSGKITGEVECDSFELPGAGKIERGSLTVHGPMEIDGAGTVEGSVRAERLEVNGSLKAAGSLDVAGELEVDGSLRTEGACRIGGSSEICGSMKAESDVSMADLEVDGSLSVNGSLTAGNVEIDGTLSVSGSLTANDVEIDGVLNAEGEVQAECFKAEGTVKIMGLLNAETVELTVSGEDLIDSIGGGRVTVRPGKSGFSLFRRKRPHLISDLIEADEIDLENTDCRVVRGVSVRIGPECVIDRVEYSGTLEIDPAAAVREQVKL